ncbi:iron complex outermembrane receptor protein [Arcicella aurantiaca]|uniref:Iron complex outermembrane receptor protein n=1 Tax=Arcicella aurantiaca TaxID=591202 RepID=A0A316DVJ9_9BACT|nr:TonB-dependent siderophore receptor [Arcicella aurantiaca]PWK22357.1 iron complex outermembrane receptor protein [Arcicella aurantiaca]
MKHIFTILILFTYTLTNAQAITGKIVDAVSNSHLQGVSVKLLSTDKGTLTDKEGTFSIEGKGVLEISNMGYKTLRMTSKTSFMLIELIPEITELQTVEVTGRTAKDYNSDYSFSATKIAILNKDIPQAIGTVTKELIADRQAFQLADAVKITSGVAPSSFYNQYNIRGISQNEEGQIINGMRTRQYYFLQPLTSNIERIEVVKGAASATFSSVDPGGSINMVTKKPLAFDKKQITMSLGSFSTIRGTLDFTGGLNPAKTLLYRLNGAYQEAGSYRDLVKNNAFLLSPSISYIPDNKTAINAEMIISSLIGNLDRGQPIFGAVAGETNLNSTPIGLNLSAPNDFFYSKEFIVTGNLTHKFSKSISFNTTYMKQNWTEDLQEHRTTNAFAIDMTGKSVTSLAGMQFIQRKQRWSTDNLNAYFNIELNTTKIKHKILVGYDLQSWQKLKGGGQNASRGLLLKDGTIANSFNINNAGNYQTITIDGVVLPKPNVSYIDLKNPSYTIRNINDYTTNVRTAMPSALTKTNAVYIQELLQWNAINLLLSLRNEWFEDITFFNAPNEKSFTNTKLLPRIGLTYGITKNINLYGTFLQGYQPQSNTVTLMPSTGAFFGTEKSAAAFKPLESDLKEIGIKSSLFQNRINLTASIYEINQKNILMNANDPTQPDLLVQRGADRSRGFEIDLAGYILQNWQINASYSFIDAKIMTDFNEKLNGERKENVPVNSANIWSRYNFESNSIFRDLALGIGLQYSGSKIPWFSRAFEVPAYTLVDVAFYYTPAKSNFQLAINMNNLLNETYWIGAQNYLRLFPGSPRNTTLTLTYKF